MMILVDLAERLHHRDDIGFLFVGRGSNAGLLKEQVVDRCLSNVVFFDEIEPTEIPGLYAQWYCGVRCSSQDA